MKTRWFLMIMLSVLGWNGVNAKEAYVVSYVEDVIRGNDYGGYLSEGIHRLRFYYDDNRTMHENGTYYSVIDPSFYNWGGTEASNSFSGFFSPGLMDNKDNLLNRVKSTRKHEGTRAIGDSSDEIFFNPKVYSLNEELDYPEWYNDINKWHNDETIQYYAIVDFEESFKDYRPTMTKHWFDGINIIQINGIENLNTSMVKDMSYMFAGCKEQAYSSMYHQFFTDFKTLFYRLDFSSVENMSHMVDGLEEIVLGAVTIPSGVNTDGCFKSLKYVELTTKNINLPNNFFNSATEECAIVFPDGFDFGTDTSNGHFTWKGGSFYGGICEPYAIFRNKSSGQYRISLSSDDYDHHEYFLDLFYDKIKEKRIREYKKADSKLTYSYWDVIDEIFSSQSSQLCEWNKWSKQLSFSSYGSENGRDKDLHYPYVHITIDPSCANYNDYPMPYGWFDFYCYYDYYNGDWEYSYFSYLPEEFKDFEGLEYIHYDLYTKNDTIIYDGLEYTIDHIESDKMFVKLFKNLTAKGDVVIPASIPDQKGKYNIYVNAIDDKAFHNCTSLTSITIPSSVKIIGEEVFSGCNNLTSVTVKWDDVIYFVEDDREINIFEEEYFKENIFEGTTYDNATLHVPMGCVEAYKNAPLWKNFKRIVSDSIVVSNIAEFKALDEGTRAQLTLNDAQVIYAGNYGTYVRDATGAIEFPTEEPSLTTGQILNGFVIGKYTTYNNIPQLMWTNVTNSDNITITNGTAIPKTLTITEAKSETYYCDLIKIDGVKITTRKEGYSTYYYAYIGDEEIQIRDYNRTISFEADGLYSIEGILIPPASYEGNYTINLTKPLKSLNNEYALLSKDKCILTFYYDNKQQARPNDYITYTLNDNSSSPGWLSEKGTIAKVVFDPSFADARPVTTRYWFNNMTNLNTIEGLKYLNTSEVTSMYSMFAGCASLTSLDLSTFDTSKTTSMSALFNGCTSLKELNLSGFNTTSVSSIRLMFQNCTSLESIDLSSFDTSTVTDLRNLFYGCTSLTGLDLSTMEIADGAQTGNMFYDCKALKSLKISSTFGKINSNACIGVGTTSAPCRVYAPEGFSFGTDTSGESFKWKGGYFKLGVDPTISVGDVTAYTGVNAEASLSLTIGHDDYTGYQFDIVLPQGMSLVKTQSGFKYKLSSRFNGDGVSCAIHQQDDGSYRAICYSTNHKTISGTEGVLITFPIVADETVAAGTYTGQIRNFTLNDIGNNSIHVPDVEFSLSVLDAATGDVNHDGCVDISDVLLTVDYILGKNPANYIRSDGDINHDGEINISDVLSIVDIILGQNSYNAPANARTSTVDELTLLRKDNTYTLCLNNHEPYAGFQMLLTLPEGSTLRKASLLADRSDGHRLIVRDHGDGTYTLIAYASDGRQLRDNGTPLLRLTVNGTQGDDEIQVKNILFSTLQRETVLLPEVNGTVTGIMDVATDNNDTAPAYNTQGQRVSPNYRGLVISGGQKRIRK